MGRERIEGSAGGCIHLLEPPSHPVMAPNPQIEEISNYFRQFREQ